MAELGLEGEPPAQLMTRHLLATEPAAVTETAAAIKRGELVVFPTDTLYGVGTYVFDEDAVRSLYAVKGRPLEKGIPILLADSDDVEKVSKSIPPAARTLIARFWPGPLTLIVPKGDQLPPSISLNDGVAVRLPDHAIARAVIRNAGGAVATTSANRSGNPPATNADQALVELGGWVTIVLDGGPTGQSTPSTIVDCRGPSLRILRRGAIGAELKQFIESIG